MPELPEVETVRRTLSQSVIGRNVTHVQINRPDVIQGLHQSADLLANTWPVSIRRHGKQLALVGQTGRVVCVHLGMTGRLVIGEPGANANPLGWHTHVLWTLDDRSTLAFVDPRRFGGLWCFSNESALLDNRWAVLGDDALTITPGQLHQRLQRTTRAVKAALLDQSVLAGLGNIYVDELLFACRVHPLTPANHLTLAQVQALVRRMRNLLDRAIDAGGSTVRDYVDAKGWSGRFQQSHRVYGRGAQPCRRCKRVLHMAMVAGRTTIWCAGCQPELVSEDV